MKSLLITCTFFSSFCFCQEYRTDTIRYYESIHASIASPLKIEITYREDLKKPRMKILKGSYIGNNIWLKEDLNVYLSRKKLRRIIEEAKKIRPEAMMSDWDYDQIVLDGTSTALYFSNWFENNQPLELNFSNPDLDTDKRGLTQYYIVFKIIEKVVQD